MPLFCQLDVTGRTEMDPAAEMLVRNILDYSTLQKNGMTRIAFFGGKTEVVNPAFNDGFDCDKYFFNALEEEA